MVVLDQPFAVATEPDRDLVRITMRGLWTKTTVDAYEREVRRAVRPLHTAEREPTWILALVDAREVGAQAQDLIAT